MKIENWENRLIAFLASVSAQEFQPGQLDCALFAAGAVQAMTGEDYSKKYVGKYSTIAEGIRKLKKAGFDDHVAYVASVLKERENPFEAQRGDVAVVDDENGIAALGIVQGALIYVLRPEGLGTVEFAQIKKAFEV